ncbi:MAG: hypothetical protein AAF571_15830 [Verrucomicrobiota bacterium]
MTFSSPVGFLTSGFVLKAMGQESRETLNIIAAWDKVMNLDHFDLAA